MFESCSKSLVHMLHVYWDPVPSFMFTSSKRDIFSLSSSSSILMMDSIPISWGFSSIVIPFVLGSSVNKEGKRPGLSLAKEKCPEINSNSFDGEKLYYNESRTRGVTVILA